MTEQAARAEMLIRRPVAEVFDAFVRPEMITQFWLESTSGPLAQGARVDWRFMVPDATETVVVTAFEDQRRIAFTWSDAVSVRLDFQASGDDATCLGVRAAGFKDAQGAVNATEGFSIVLCELKILLETGRPGQLVRDKAALIAQAR